jgi:hypothetical protein
MKQPHENGIPSHHLHDLVRLVHEPRHRIKRWNVTKEISKDAARSTSRCRSGCGARHGTANRRSYNLEQQHVVVLDAWPDAERGMYSGFRVQRSLNSAKNRNSLISDQILNIRLQRKR